MNLSECAGFIATGRYDEVFTLLYGADSVMSQRERYSDAVREFRALYGECEMVELYSAPGRTEIGGNHTDHNHGRVLAASINLDVIAVVARTDGVIHVKSAGYKMDTIMLDDLSVHEEDVNHAASLIRGVADGFVRNGYKVGGFCAYTTSNVLKGSGLSSSAAFEVLIGTILNHEYNDATVDAVKIAQFSQYAENVHFGKPSGLMDQMASSVGGMISIDFADPVQPVINQVEFDFAKCGYRLCVVETGGDHTDLTPEYAAIPIEMKAVAASLGRGFLRETSYEELFSRLPEMRKQHGDRAVLRALHFLGDNDRVARQVDALNSGDFDSFLKMVTESGHSSFEYLQNIYVASDFRNQGMSLALCAAQRMLSGCGAWRVHGGGFAGTTLNFVPENMADSFAAKMEQIFGVGCCHTLSIRPVGGIRLACQ